MNNIYTDRFKTRTITLENCFNAKMMEKAWQKYVKIGMRNQDLLDLHDYYDFHRNRKEIIERIRKQILDGSYKPKTPHIIRLEKKYGVCRHIQIPTPEDAVVLQSLVEAISPSIKESQKSEKAFYSRSHKQPKSEKDIDETFPYQWWELWPVFQERIYEFSSKFNFIVITDISNYFDNISFRQLRNVISSFGKFEECLLDFLFFMLETFVWRPDYLPLSGVGLPQVNFDAPRLLGHAFLFEIDEYLKSKTDNNFVRWMDDIDFGVNDMDYAKTILRSLDEILLTRGLRLNIGKTKILSFNDAKEYFLPNENRYLTIMSRRVKKKLKNNESVVEETRRIKKRFRVFNKKPQTGRWEKVLMRYFTMATLLRDPFLLKYVPESLKNKPGIRAHIYRYISELNPTKKRLSYISDFILNNTCLDDKAIFYAAKVLTDWRLSPESKIIPEINKFAYEIIKNQSSTRFISSLWILTKYEDNKKLFNFIKKNREIWKYSNFASRQIAAIIPRIRNKESYDYIINELADTGQIDALRIVYNLNELRQKENLSDYEILYLQHGSDSEEKIKLYPLSKFLIVTDVLKSTKINHYFKTEFKSKLLSILSDPIYLKEINAL